MLRFSRYPNIDVLKFSVSEKITSQYSKNIISKLDEHNSLSIFYKFFENNHRLMEQECRQIDDIIDVLYFASNGRHFVDHIKESISFKDEYEKKFLLALIELGNLNITSIPLPIFVLLFKGLHITIDLKQFRNDYSDWILCQDNKIKVRAHRLLQKCFSESLSVDEREELLCNIVFETVGLFSEGTYNEFTDLFQNALLFKKILSTGFLPIEKIDHFYTRVEKECEDYSFYWVQRGLEKQQQESYEFAESYLRKALSINPKSYQVKHALAKNDMTRGLAEIMSNGSTDNTFMSGYKDMQVLLENPAYSRAFSYSAHTLINMQMRFLSITHKKMEYELCERLVNRLCQNRLDELVLKIVHEYVHYLKPEYGDLSQKLKNYIDEYEAAGTMDLLDDDIVLFVSNESV